MKLFRGAVDTIKRVYRYEKTTGMDVGALQGVMLIFAVVLFLIDIENFRLGKYVIGIVTLVVGIVSVTAVFVIRRFQKVVLVCRIAVFLFLLLAAAILYAGANDVFSLLWYLLLPVITLVPLGMPFGAPVCIGFGLWIMAFFWTPLADILRYDYPRDYRVFYPIFYWGFCLMVVAMDIFYKNYQIRQQQNEENLENEVQEAVAGTKNLMIHSVTAISQLIDAKDRYTREHSQRVAEYSRLIADYMKGGHATGEELELIYRSGLLHDIGKPETLTVDEDGTTHFHGHPAVGEEMARRILRRLRFDNDTVAVVTRLVRYHDYGNDVTPDLRIVRRAVNKIGEDIFPLLFPVRQADILAQSDYLRAEKLKNLELWKKLYEEMLEKKQCVSLKTLAVTGRDLIAMGMKPGRELGDMLQKLLELVLEHPEQNTREQLLEKAGELAAGKE